MVPGASRRPKWCVRRSRSESGPSIRLQPCASRPRSAGQEMDIGQAKTSLDQSQYGAISFRVFTAKNPLLAGYHESLKVSALPSTSQPPTRKLCTSGLARVGRKNAHICDHSEPVLSATNLPAAVAKRQIPCRDEPALRNGNPFGNSNCTTTRSRLIGKLVFRKPLASSRRAFGIRHLSLK